MTSTDSRPSRSRFFFDLFSRAYCVLWLALAGFVLLPGCADRKHVLYISVPMQKMAVVKEGVPIREFPVSTSKYGLGDQPGSYRTPAGTFEIARKIGTGAPSGAVFKSRRRTGEVLPPNAPGRDPIVSRILWLRGLEPQNQNAYGRYIYIHGTAEERNVGIPVSYGCIRMKSRDVIELYDIVGRGARVHVVTGYLPPPRPAVAGNPGPVPLAASSASASF